MHVAVYIALALAVVVAPTGRLAARRLAPRPAALTLVAVAICAAAGWVWSLSLLAVALVNRAPDGAGQLLGVQMSDNPVPTWVGLVAALLVGASAARVLQALCGEFRRIRATHRAVSACGPANGELLVIVDPVPQAFVVPSLRHHPGRIVVSTAMLQALDADERAVLLAHERSHLHNRHSWLRTSVSVAAAAHPILGRIDNQLAAALERWDGLEPARRRSLPGPGRSGHAAGVAQQCPVAREQAARTSTSEDAPVGSPGGGAAIPVAAGDRHRGSRGAHDRQRR